MTKTNPAGDPAIEISPRAASTLLKSEPRAKLIDVRTNDEWALARIDGAVLVNGDKAVQEVLSWPKDTPLIVHCHHGVRSLGAAKFLLNRGFSNVKSLAGGIDAWSTEMDPSVPRY